MSTRTRALAMVVGLVVGMAALVGTIILLEADETAAGDKGGTEQPTDDQTPAGDTGGPEQPTDEAGSAPSAVTESGWPAAVEFRPAALGDAGTEPTEVADVEPGLYLWSDFEGWHLWSAGSGRSVTGSVVVDGEFGAADDEAGPATVDKTEQGRIEFSLEASDISGIRFNPGFFSNQIEIRVDGEPLPVLFLGRDATRATLPVVVAKNQPIRTLDD